MAATRLSSRSASASARRALSSAERAPRSVSRASFSPSLACAQLGLGLFQRLPSGFHRRLRRRHLGFQFGQPVAASQPLRGGARRIGRGDVAVPAPQVAFAADQPLAGPQHGLQARPVGALDQPGQRQAAGEHRRRPHMGGKRFDSRGQGAILGGGVDLAPARRRLLVGGGVEVVAEGRSQRRLEAGVDGDRVDHRRVAVGSVADQDRGKRRRLGLDLAERMVGARELLAGAGALVARHRYPLLGGVRRRFGGARRVLGGFRRLPALGHHRPGRAGAIERGDLALHLGDLATKPLRPPGRLARRPLVLAALGAHLGVPAGELGQLLLALADGGLGRMTAAGGGRLALVHRRIGGLQFLLFLVQPGDHRAVVGDHALLAGDVVGELGEAPVELGEPAADALFLGVERFRRERDALGGGCRPRRLVAEVGDVRRGDGLVLRRLGLFAGALVGERRRGGKGASRPRSAPRWRRARAGAARSPRPGGSRPTGCGSAPPGGPGASARRAAARSRR